MSNTYKIASNAYYEAIQNGHGHTKKLQDEACKELRLAYYYARDVVGADIGYCQEWACKDPKSAFYFALNVEGADIEYCQEWACKDPKCAYWFAADVKGADLEACLEAVKESVFEEGIKKLIINIGLE